MPADLRRILKLEVPIIVVLGDRAMRAKEVVNLVPGAIVELPKKAEDELTLLANNQPVGMGYAVKVGENFGVKITYIGDIKSRIAALGGASAASEPADADAEALAEAMLAGQV